MKRFFNPMFRLLARLLLGFLLATQFVLAAQACLLPVFRPAVALASESPPSDSHGLSGQSMAGCLAHCLQPNQTVGTNSVASLEPAPDGFVALPHQAVPLAGIPVRAAPGLAQPVDIHESPPFLRFLRLRN